MPEKTTTTVEPTAETSTETTATVSIPVSPTPAVPVTTSPADLAGKGFPENTPVAEMTDSQKAAYYQHHRKLDRKRADHLSGELTRLKQQISQISGGDAATAGNSAVSQAGAPSAPAVDEEAIVARVTAQLQAEHARKLVEVQVEAELTARGLSAQTPKVLAALKHETLLDENGQPDKTKLYEYVQLFGGGVEGTPLSQQRLGTVTTGSVEAEMHRIRAERQGDIV